MCKFSKQRKTLQQFVSTLKSLPTLIKLQKFMCAIFGEAIKNKPVRM